jgi:hypothetical protein
MGANSSKVYPKARTVAFPPQAEQACPRMSKIRMDAIGGAAVG